MVVMSRKMKLFQICFSEPDKTYSSGDKVCGRVLLEVVEVMRVQVVRMQACGVASVQWSKECKQQVEYLRYDDVLHLEDNSTDVDGSIILRPGNKYEFKFGFELPQGPLGTSFRGKFGTVEYWVKALVERPNHPPHETLQNFEVLEPVDISTPDLMVPVSATKEEKVSCMFIPDGQVSVFAKIDRQGFCEGEEICINANFENTSSRIVMPKAAIIAKHTYLANGQTRVYKQKISRVRGDHIVSGMSDCWRGKSIRVPKIKPSILGCHILRVEYYLMIYVHVPGTKKVILELPLVIGTSSSGHSSRISSVASAGSVASSEMSWVSLNIPDNPEAPPCYMDIIPEDYQLESPTSPLLDDLDSSYDGPIFMYTPEFKYMPPPTYTEIDPSVNQNEVTK
ncbi:thioredoxin-interacting protein [Protopterus annectens]|uniref:thioredoxin-interacting protein n=1 Tax=Protopterus annectens TaxID=7888 RepID=UPI001CFBE2AC|nr:thioredoxin-interacting protein [Protopterus annectens]